MEAEWGKAALGRDAFVEEVWRQGNAAYRDLPLRNIDDPDP